MEQRLYHSFDPPRNFDIEEVEASSNERENDLISGGPVENWRYLEYSEKARVRIYIAFTVMSVWVTWTFVGLIRFLTAGDPFLLVSSPTILVVPLYSIVKFYFRSG